MATKWAGRVGVPVGTFGNSLKGLLLERPESSHPIGSRFDVSLVHSGSPCTLAPDVATQAGTRTNCSADRLQPVWQVNMTHICT
jgi:hypothetical protein